MKNRYMLRLALLGCIVVMGACPPPTPPPGGVIEGNWQGNFRQNGLVIGTGSYTFANGAYTASFVPTSQAGTAVNSEGDYSADSTTGWIDFTNIVTNNQPVSGTDEGIYRVTNGTLYLNIGEIGQPRPDASTLRITGPGLFVGTHAKSDEADTGSGDSADMNAAPQ